MSSRMPAVRGAPTTAEPMRVDTDGNPYTKAQFFSYYKTDARWNAAPIYYSPTRQKKATSPTSSASSLAGLPALSPTSSTQTSPMNARGSPTTAKSFSNEAKPKKTKKAKKKPPPPPPPPSKKLKERHSSAPPTRPDENPSADPRMVRRNSSSTLVKPTPAPTPYSGSNSDDSTLARKAFEKYDTDHDGTLDQEEVGKALRELGVKMSDHEFDVIFAEYDVDGNGTLDLPEFTLMMGRQRDSDDSKDSLRQAFSKCDADGSGTLELQELKEIMNEFGVEMDDEELREIFNEADVDGSGTIDYNEFVDIMGTE